MQCNMFHVTNHNLLFPNEMADFNISTYFLPLICRRWWKTLMTSRIRRGASSILEAKLIHAMATICEDNQGKKMKERVQQLQTCN